MKKNWNYKYIVFPVICIALIGVGLNSAFADVTPGAEFKNPLAVQTVEDMLNKVLDAVRGIVAILAVTMIVVGGILYITSAGDPGRVQLAKTAVTAALIGLAIAVVAPTFLREIYGVLGSTGQPSVAIGAKPLSTVLLDALEFLLSIIGVLSILMLVIGGVMYLTSAGDSGRAETAKNTIKFAIVGLIVAILSLVIVKAIVELF